MADTAIRPKAEEKIVEVQRELATPKVFKDEMTFDDAFEDLEMRVEKMGREVKEEMQAETYISGIPEDMLLGDEDGNKKPTSNFSATFAPSSNRLNFVCEEK